MLNQIALVGTNKGLIEFNVENDQLIPGKVHFKGFSITMIFIDSETWWIGLNHRHWGPKLHRSDDQGNNWEEMKVPGFGDLKLSNGKDATLRQIWVMSKSKDTLWMGTDPGGLFQSSNEGKSFELVDSLWNHPSRGDINQWFGAGSDFPFLHTIEPHPIDENLIFVGVSSAGVFATTDHGKNLGTKKYGLEGHLSSE